MINVANSNKIVDPRDARDNSVSELNPCKMEGNASNNKIPTKNVSLLEASKERYDFADSFLFIISQVLYIILVISVFEIEQRFKVSSELQTYFQIKKKAINYNNVQFLNDFNKVIEKINHENFWFKDKKYEIISNIRITQRKVKLSSSRISTSPLISEQFFNEKQWATDNIYLYSQFRDSVEESEPFSNFRFDKESSFYGLGGYVIEFNKANHDIADLKKKMTDFITHETSCITYDMLIAHYEYNYLCEVIISYQLNRSGLGLMTYSLNIMNTDLYSKARAIFPLIVLTLYLITSIAYFVIFILNLTIKCNSIHNKYLNRKDQKNVPSKYLIFFKLIVFDGLCLIQFVSFILSFISLVFWLTYVIMVQTNIKTINEAFQSNVILDFGFQNKIRIIFWFFSLYYSFVIFYFIFVFIRLVKILSNIIPSAFLFIRTLYLAFEDMIFYFILLLCLILGFSLFSWLYFGLSIKSMNTFSSAFHQNVSFILGIYNSKSLGQIYYQKSEMSFIYMIILLILIRFVIVRLLVAIILYAFSIVHAELEFETIQQNYLLHNIKPALPKRLAMFFSSNVNKVFDSLCRSKKTKANKLKSLAFNSETDKTRLLNCPYTQKMLETMYFNEHRVNSRGLSPKKTLTLKRINDERELLIMGHNNELCNASYQEDYELSFFNTMFESVVEKMHIKTYFERKYCFVFYHSLLFLLFIGFNIAMFYYNTLSPWRFGFYKYFLEIFSVLSFDSTNEKGEKTKVSFNAINSIVNTRDFIFKHMTSAFTEVNGLNAYDDHNYLIGKYLLLTVRKSLEIENNEINKDTQIRRKENINKNKLNFEQKEYIEVLDPIGNKKYPFLWDQSHSYKGRGGYYMLLELNKILPAEIQQKLVDQYTNNVILELMLINYDYEVAIYIKIHIQMDFGGYYTNDMQISIIKYNVLQTPLDYIKISLEVITCLFLIYYIYYFISTLINKIHSYISWHKAIIDSLQPKLKSIRISINPESLRAVFVILDFKKINDLLIIIALCFGFVFRFLLLKYQLALNSLRLENVIDEYELREVAYKAINNHSNYEFSEMVVIFLTLFRVLTMLNIGKYLSLIIKTIKDSNANNIVFILLLIFLQPGFIFFTYIGFGENNYNYHTLPNAIISLLKLLFGYVNYTELAETSPKFGSFFYFVYLIIFRLTLFNMFVSIIYTHFMKIKIIGLGMINNFDWINVIFFCRKNLNTKEVINHRDVNKAFDFDKMIKRSPSVLLINKDKLLIKEWIKLEGEQIQMLDKELLETKIQQKEFKLLTDSINRGQPCALTKDKYFNYKLKHINTLKLWYMVHLLDIQKQLEDDTFTISKFVYHIQEHNKVNHYDGLIANIKEKIELTSIKIGKIDRNFFDIKKGLTRLSELTNPSAHQKAEIKQEDIDIKILDHNGSIIKTNNEEEKKGDISQGCRVITSQSNTKVKFAENMLSKSKPKADDKDKVKKLNEGNNREEEEENSKEVNRENPLDTSKTMGKINKDEENDDIILTKEKVNTLPVNETILDVDVINNSDND